MSDPLRMAVVGLGYWGPNLVRNLFELETCEVTTACDLDPDRLGRIARRYPSVRLTSNFDDVLSDPTIDAVLIATPVSTHYTLGRAALEAGKHLFVEKPLAASVAEAEDLAAIAVRLDRVLMPGHTFLYSPPVIAIHDRIVAGELGDILFVTSSRVNLGLHQSDVSVIWDLGPHDFSILRYWLGESPTHISAMARSCVIPTIPDVAFVNLEFPSGAIAHVEMSWLAPTKLRRTTVVGSRKMVVYDDTSTEPVRIHDSGVDIKDPENFGEYRLTYRAGEIVSPHVDVSEPLSLELRDFCAAISNGVHPRSSMLLGIEVVRMIEGADRSLAANGGRVELVGPVRQQ